MFGVILSVLDKVLALAQVTDKVIDKVKPKKKRNPRRRIDRDERPQQNHHARRH